MGLIKKLNILTEAMNNLDTEN